MEMNRQKKNNKYFVSVLYTLMLIWMLYVSDSMVFALNVNRLLMTYARISLILAGICSFVMILINNHFKINLYLLVACLFMIVTCMLYGGATYYIFVSKVATFFCGYYIARYFDNDRLIKTYIKLMFFIAVFSLIGYVFPSVFNKFPLPTIATSTRENTFRCAFFTNIPVQKWVATRNYGPFWEPGAYEAFLNLALFFVLFVCDEISSRKKMIYSLIFCITIISTLSTTGLVAMPTLLMAYIFKNKSHTKANGLASKIIIFIILCVSAFYVLGESGVFENNIINKLNNGDTSRYLFPRYSVIASFKNPIFGLGGTANDYIMALNGGQPVSFTNTLTAHLVYFGLYVALYYIYENYMMLKSVLKSHSTSFVLCLAAFLVLLCGEYYFYSPMFAFLMFYRYKKSKSENGR